MLTGHRDTDVYLCKYLGDRDLFNLCQVVPGFCKDENFWKQKFITKYGQFKKSSNKSWREIYLQLKGGRNFYELMILAVEIGEKDLVEFFIKKYYWRSDWNWNYAMRKAAQGGHRDLVEFFIEKGADEWNCGMNGAAKGGHRDLVDFFIEKGADDWNWGMKRAAEGGHLDLIKFFIEKGANKWNEGMESAAEYGHRDLVEFFIEKGADDWDRGMQCAAGGDGELVEFFISKGANQWGWGLFQAIVEEKQDLIEFFIQKYKENGLEIPSKFDAILPQLK